MSDATTATPQTSPAAGDGHGHGHGQDHGHGHAHNPFQAHHFDTPEQQIESGKLGMWLFLATEILLFSGLFCAYAVYRCNHPDIFTYAHQFLDKTWGGVNTMVLLFSSLTMAWAVRAAQLGQQRTLKVMLAITLFCGFGFLGVKFIEYKAKFEHGTLWGENYKPTHEGHGEADHGNGAASHDVAAGSHSPAAGDNHGATTPAGPQTGPAHPAATEVVATSLAKPAASPTGTIRDAAGKPTAPDYALRKHADDEPNNVHIFFGVYFVMTGLHGIHVIVGMIVIGWLLFRSFKGHFGPQYNEPVDLGGLYWHLVDLIWIYLFPLLYLVD